MAYNSQTGKWEVESADVGKQVSGLLGKNSEYLKAAKTGATKASNRRGLLNSSIAAGAGVDAAIKSSLPIAQQNAAQIQQQNVQSGAFEHEAGQQTQRLEHDTASQERQIGAAEAAQIRDIQAQAEAQGRDLTAQEQAQLRELEQQQTLQQSQFEQEQTLQSGEFGQQQTLQQQQFQQEANQLATQLESQEKISFANIASYDREKTAALAAAYENSYTEAFRTIGQNENLPAKVRDKYLAHAATIRDNNYALMQQLYGVEIDWGDAA